MDAGDRITDKQLKKGAGGVNYTPLMNGLIY